MLESYILDEDEGYTFYADGCGCCTKTYYLDKHKDKIIEKLKDTYKELCEMCDIVGVDINDIINK